MVLCEQLLKGIVYPLAVKSTQILALAHQAKTKTNKQTNKQRCSLLQLDPVPSLCWRAFTIFLDRLIDIDILRAFIIGLCGNNPISCSILYRRPA